MLNDRTTCYCSFCQNHFEVVIHSIFAFRSIHQPIKAFSFVDGSIPCTNKNVLVVKSLHEKLIEVATSLNWIRMGLRVAFYIFTQKWSHKITIILIIWLFTPFTNYFNDQIDSQSAVYCSCWYFYDQRAPLAHCWETIWSTHLKLIKCFQSNHISLIQLW